VWHHGLVNGNGNFWPPTESTPPQPIIKKCHRWLYRRPLQIRQIWCTSVHGVLPGEWVKYYQIYLCHFLGTHLQVRPVGGYSRVMAQTTRTCARMCLVGFVDMALHLGGQIPLQKILGAWIGVFKPNSRNRKTCCHCSDWVWCVRAK